MDLIDEIRNFIKDTLPENQKIPYLVNTPRCISPSYCERLVRTKRDKIHEGITLPADVQDKVTTYFDTKGMHESDRLRVYIDYLNLLHEDSPTLDYTLTHVKRIEGRQHKTPHLLLSFHTGTHRYSFYI